MNNSFLNRSEIRLYTIKVTIETNIDNNKNNNDKNDKIISKVEVKEIVYNYLKTNNKLNGNTAPNRYNLIKLFSLMLGNTFLQTSIIIAIPPASA